MVERGNVCVKDALVAWMQENCTTQWTVGLKFVQWEINHMEHEAIKMILMQPSLVKECEWVCQRCGVLTGLLPFVHADLRIAGVRDAHVSEIKLFAALHASPALRVIIMNKSASLSR